MGKAHKEMKKKNENVETTERSLNDPRKLLKSEKFRVYENFAAVI